MSKNKSSFNKEKPYYLTEDGLKKLQEKKKKTEMNLINVLSRKEETARTCGDVWHDNPTLYQLEAEERSLRMKLGQLESDLKKARIVSESNHHSGDEELLVGMGSYIEVEFVGGSEMSLTVTDPEMASISDGLISYKSPLVEAIGKSKAKKGDEVSYVVNGKTIKVLIKKIKNIKGGD